MPSSVEITAPVAVKLQEDRVSHGARVTGDKTFIPYPLTHNFEETGKRKHCGTHSKTGKRAHAILPFMTRLHSPVRVTFKKDVTGKERSRVSEQTRSAIFNYRPLKRRDQPFLLSRLRTPEATSTWVSVTKSDYGDPNSDSECSDNEGNPRRLFTRSLTDLGPVHHSKVLYTKQTSSTTQTSTDLTQKQETKQLDKTQQDSETSELSKNDASVASSQTDKHVTIVDSQKSKVVPPIKMQNTKKMYSEAGDCSNNTKGPNYYNGYLPLEKSEEIAEKLHLRPSTEGGQIINRAEHRVQLAPTLYQKPLIGDRSSFLRGGPTRVYRPHIGQIGSSDQQRFGPVTVPKLGHFSAFSVSPMKHKHHTVNVRSPGVATDKASLYKTPSTIELFQRQREKTYHLQSVAKEMIKN